MSEQPFLLETLLISGFRAYLKPKAFDFRTKRSLAVFAPNGFGKSSLVDSLEFMFSDDGTLARVGVRTIHNKAGVAALAHNLAAERSIDSVVNIGFRRGKEKLEGSRKTTGSRSRPAVVDAVQKLLAVSPIIRGYELRRFVEAQTAEERYEDVARWLQLSPFVNVQKNLRDLRRRTKAASEDRSSLKGFDAEILKITGGAFASWSDADALRFANDLLAKLDKTLALGALSRVDNAFVVAGSRANDEEKKLGLDGLKQIRQTILSVYEQSKVSGDEKAVKAGLLPAFNASIKTLLEAEAVEAAEREVAANSMFAELWRVAEPLFAESGADLGVCPICTTPFDIGSAGSTEGVREHIAKHRSELAAYANAKRALDEARASLEKVRARLAAGLKALNPLISDAFSLLKPIIEKYLISLEAWKEGAIPDDVELTRRLDEVVGSVNEEIDKIEARQGESTYIKTVFTLERLIELKEARDREVLTKLELQKISTALNLQAAFIATEIRRKVQALLDTFQGPINAIYQAIQGEGAAAVRLELPSEDDTNQQRLNLVIDFAANREGVQPSGYLSDSQIHSLALALRLAAIQRCNPLIPVIVLDDIVTSYDADHRRAIASLIAREFSNSQIIITTHDERFFIYLKDQLGDQGWHFTRIIRLDDEFGPRFMDDRVTDEMIEARWHAGESAANEMRQAEEEWLLRVCREFGVAVRIRSVEKAYSYDRAELADALATYLAEKGLTPPLVPGVNNRFLKSIQQGAVENFGSHFQDNPFGDRSAGDEKVRWAEFKLFRDKFICPKCKKGRFKRPFGLSRPVCAKDGCEEQFSFQ